MIKEIFRLLPYFTDESEAIKLAKGKNHLDTNNVIKTIKRAWLNAQ